MGEATDRRNRRGPRYRRAAAAPLCCLAVFLVFAQSRPAVETRAAAGVVTRQTIGLRLERAVEGSKQLFDRAESGRNLPYADPIAALIPEDGPAVLRRRFSTLADAREYWRLRPWEPAYVSASDVPMPVVATEQWPTRGDAPALRDLMGHPDPAIRGLAVEALGALALPEDIGRFGALLGNTEISAPGLARISQRGGTRPQPSADEQMTMPLVWSDRTVGAYARAAVRLLTGNTFNERPDFRSESFSEWIETHDLGWDSLWYWEHRLGQEERAVPAVEQTPGEDRFAFGRRRNEANRQHRADLRKRSESDLDRLSAHAQAKVYLLTSSDLSWDTETGPVNRRFPEGFTLRIPRERILELLNGVNIWRDCVDSNAETVLLWRLGRLAPAILPPEDWPHVRQQLQTRASGQPAMPVLVSRLLPPASTVQAHDPSTREGYLRRSLERAVNERRLWLIAAEMVRTNVEAHWPFLSARFSTNPAAGASERRGMLEALAEAPHSIEKLEAAVAFVNDPRNAPALTLGNVSQADVYRRLAIEAINAFSPSGARIPYQLQEDLGVADRQSAALEELRRRAQALLAQARSAPR